MNKLISGCILISFIFVSCTTVANVPNVNYNYPNNGITNNAVLAVKDYEPIEIIFVKSSEVIDGDGNHTGSKITYEMLMLEAQKLEADDVINIKIDVNQKEEIIKTNDNYYITQTTYNYTASALAIKYTTAIQTGNPANSFQDIGNDMIIPKEEQKAGSSTSTAVGVVLAILAGIGTLWVINDLNN
jgi:hypothetical protein